MKAMLWKEWRENGRWGILACLGLGLALTYVVTQANSPTSGAQDDKCAGVWNAAYTVLTFGCPLIGAALGFAQAAPELRRDQWAFLVHRPVPPSILFWGKAVVGLGLALAAAGLPFLLFALWTAVPRAVAAPTDARLTLPGVAALLTIFPAYFAGMLTALRPARWYGSRALALPAGIAAVLLAVAGPEFWDAAAVAVLGVALGFAAWGSFLTKGQYAGQPRPAILGLGTTLYVGIIVTAGTVIGLIGGLLSTLFPQTNDYGNYSYYSINAQGRILRLDQNHRGQFTATDLNGRPITLPKTANGGYSANALPTASLLGHGNDTSSYEVSGGAAYRKTTRLVVPLGESANNGDSVSWYYVPRERRAVGYEQTWRRPAGFLGPAGLSPPSDVAAPRFEASYPLRRPWGDDLDLFRFPQTVYWVDPTGPSVTRIYAATRPGDLQGACVVGGQAPPGFGPGVVLIKVIIVAASDGFHAYTLQGAPLFRLPREHDPARYRSVDVAMTPDGKRFFFWYNAANPPWMGQASAPTLPSYVTEVTSAGRVRNRFVLPPLPRFPGTPTPPADGAFGLLAPPLAPLGLAGALEIGHRLGNADADEVASGLYDPNTRIVWRVILFCSTLSGLLSSLLAWRIARRCVLPPRARLLWAFGVFWLGIYGVLMLLALREWPALVPCPNCKRPRVVTRETCEHCGAAFERPARDGTEIFDTEVFEVEKVAL